MTTSVPSTPRSKRKASRLVPENPRFIILTGLSGSGKSQVHKCFEDLGYFCIDNLPMRLVPDWARLWKAQKHIRTTLILDVREPTFQKEFGRVYEALRKMDVKPHLLFLESDDAVLIRRFSETRRPHPLARKGELLPDSIGRERRMLQSVRKLADDVINTSRQTVHQLRKLVFEKYGRRQVCLVSVTSFGYRFGIPPESDLVIDVRILPNPFFEPSLKARTGLDRRVIRFMRSFEETQTMLQKTVDYMRFLLPFYLSEGKSYLTISFGCTGGKHRSVFMAEQVGHVLAADGYDVSVSHRDINAE